MNIDENFFDDLNYKLYDPAPGRLLISEPFLPDPNFSRSVVLLAAAGEEGAMGFVLNKRTELKLQDVLPDMENMDFPLFMGGPVGLNELFFIHTLGEKLGGSMKITEGLWAGGNFEQLKANLHAGEIGDNEIRFFTGYSGWAEGQLEDEIEGKSWIVTTGSPEMIMKQSDDFWKEILSRLGEKFEIMSRFPQNPGMN